MARTLPLLLFCLMLSWAADGVDAQAATVITQESTAPRWRVVAGPEVTAPRSTVIPAQTTGLQREVAGTAQEDATLPADAQVAAAPIRPAYLIRPSLGGGLPTGFVGGWGDYFVSASAGTPGNTRPDADASFNLGFALGDPEKLVGVDVYLGIGSFKNLNANGAFGADMGRLLVNTPNLQLGVAGGGDRCLHLWNVTQPAAHQWLWSDHGGPPPARASDKPPPIGAVHSGGRGQQLWSHRQQLPTQQQWDVWGCRGGTA